MPIQLDNAYAAVERAAAVRADLRRCYPDDRDARLMAVLDDLAAAMKPLRARLLHAPSLGRTKFEPKVRAASEAVQVERRRVREMLRRDSGGARPSQRAPRVKPAEIRGTLKQAKGQARAIREELGTADQPGPMRAIARRTIRSWQTVWSIREDASEYLDTLRSARVRLTTAERRFELWWLDRYPDGRDMPSAYRAIRREVYMLQLDLDELERCLIPLTKLKPTKPKPVRRKWQRWTADSATVALTNWTRRHGRRPTARDLTDPALPSYGTVHRVLGGLPVG